jgi:hypothetical protein
MVMTGMSNVLSNFEKLSSTLEDKANKALATSAIVLKVRSQIKTPVDTGKLKASHFIIEVENSSGPMFEIGCQTDYAPDQHENLEYAHSVGEAKFLQRALDESITDIRDIISKKVKTK